jgi:hypothetical protein
MAIDLIALSSSDSENLKSFLQKHFKLPDDAPQLTQACLHWKYFQMRPDWDGPRSYVLRSGSRWLAHAGVCPMLLERGDQRLRAILLVDWVSASPGAGAEIFRRFYPQIDILVCNGGSSGARKTFQALEYPVAGSVDYFTRPLKPWRLFRARVGKGFSGAMARLLRDSALSRVPLYRPAKTWTVDQIDCFTLDTQDLYGGGEPSSFWQTQRSRELLNYFLRCPFAQVSAYRIAKSGGARGYFMLADCGEEIRLVDLRLSSEQSGDWCSAVALAARIASEGSASFMTASCSFPLMRQAILANRFRQFQTDPLYLYEPKNILPQGALLHITPFDGDQAYL